MRRPDVHGRLHSVRRAAVGLQKPPLALCVLEGRFRVGFGSSRLMLLRTGGAQRRTSEVGQFRILDRWVKLHREADVRDSSPCSL